MKNHKHNTQIWIKHDKIMKFLDIQLEKRNYQVYITKYIQNIFWFGKIYVNRCRLSCKFLRLQTCFTKNGIDGYS